MKPLLILLLIFSSCSSGKKKKYLFEAFFKEKANSMSKEELKKHNATDVQGGVALVDSYEEIKVDGNKRKKYRSFLFKAIKKKNSKTFRRLLARNNVNTVDPVTGDSLLHYAIIMKKIAHIKVILKQNPSMKHKNKKGYDPLGLAKRLKRKKAIKIITRHLREKSL